MNLSPEEFQELASYGEIGEKAAIYITWLEAKLERIRRNFQADIKPAQPRAPVPRRDRKKQRRRK